MGDRDYWGVFGPGDGQPVAVYDDGDIAAREKRKRFGDGGFVAPVTLNAKQLAEAAEAQASVEPAGGPSPLIHDGMAGLRARARAEVEQEELMKVLKDEVRGDVQKELKARFSTGKAELSEAAKASDAAAADHREAVEASHASVTEAATGEKPPAGELPTSPMHSVGPAPGAQGIASAGVRADEAPEPGMAQASTASTSAEPQPREIKPASTRGNGNRSGQRK
jgi:hypothetical protein